MTQRRPMRRHSLGEGRGRARQEVVYDTRCLAASAQATEPGRTRSIQRVQSTACALVPSEVVALLPTTWPRLLISAALLVLIRRGNAVIRPRCHRKASKSVLPTT